MKVTSKQIRTVVAIALVAVVMRLYVKRVMFVTAKDTLWFVTGARAIAQGDLEAWLAQHQHPLTGLCVWLGGLLSGDWILGGRLFNVVIGSLSVIPAYLLGRVLFGHWAGLCAAWFLAFHAHAARFSADVLSEPLYLFCILWAVLFGLLAVQERKGRWLALCGVASGLAYLTRPEGLGVALVTAGWVCCHHLRELGGDWRQRLARLLTLAIPCALLATPYMVHIGGPTKKKKATEIIKFRRVGSKEGVTSVPGKSQAELIVKGTAEVDRKRPSVMRHYAGSAYNLASKLVSACTHVLVPFVVVGLLWRRRFSRSGTGELYIGSVVLLYLLVLYGVRTTAGYVSRRHAFPLAIMLLTWSGAGAVVIAQWLSRIRAFANSRAAAMRWVMAVMAVLLVGRTAQPQNTRNLGEARAGLWIRHDCSDEAKVITLELSRAACYAYSWDHELHEAFFEEDADGVRVKNPERESFWGVLDYACRIGATHVVLDENRMYELMPDFIPDAEEAIARKAVPRLELCRRLKRSPRDARPTVYIYRVVRPSGKKRRKP